MSCVESIGNAFPAIGLCTIIFWSYYAYVVALCIYIIVNSLKQIAYLIVYHILFLTMMYSYAVTMFANSDGVPLRYRLDAANIEMIRSMEDANEALERFCRSKRIVVYTTNSDGTIRFCKKCEHIKPDRTHHCSTCNRCILKMDHHCPWVNNCVGYSNYKQFVLFLLYSSFYCVFTFGTLAEYVVQFFVANNIEDVYGYHITAMLLCSGVFGMAVISLLVYHITLVLANKTTLEDLKEPEFIDPTFTFDLGAKDNFTEVFGEDCCLWFVPIKTAKGNGFVFPVQII